MRGLQCCIVFPADLAGMYPHRAPRPFLVNAPLIFPQAAHLFDPGWLCRVRSSDASRTGIAALITQRMGCNAGLSFPADLADIFPRRRPGHFWTTPLETSANGPPLRFRMAL